MSLTVILQSINIGKNDAKAAPFLLSKMLLSLAAKSQIQEHLLFE